VALRAEVVDLVGLHLLHHVDEARRVGQVAVVQDEAAVSDVRILVQVIDAPVLNSDVRRLMPWTV
jgi:hypothetical protein